MSADDAKKIAMLNQVFNTLDANGDGELTKDEVVAGAGQLKITAEEAAKLFDDLDEDKSGTLTRNEFDAAASMLEEYEKMMAETAELEAEAAIAEKEVAAAEEAASDIIEKAKAEAAAKATAEVSARHLFARRSPFGAGYMREQTEDELFFKVTRMFLGAVTHPHGGFTNAKQIMMHCS